MKIKSLLLGSAAAMVAVSGAQAADAIVVEPEPVEYVRVCDMYGAGYFYIPGDANNTCIRFAGYVPDEDLPALLGRSRAVVLPYLRATQSAVLNVAASAGAPVVVSEVVGLADATDGGSLTVPPADPVALARAIERVVDEPDLVADLRALQRARAERNDPEVLVEELISYYRELVDR